MLMSKKDWLYFAMFAAIMTAGTLITKFSTQRRAAAERTAKEKSTVVKIKLNVREHQGAAHPKPEKPTAELYRGAAEKGDAQAQFDLAMCYRNGLGVEKDEKQAAEWLRKAAAQGHAEAKKALEEPKP